MTKSLKPGERNAVKLLLRCERIKQGEEFTSAEAWHFIAGVPTYAGRNRDTRYIHNKYKLTYILKKCGSFSRVLTPNGTSVWVYEGENDATQKMD
ncbi:MAG: hypothetical protein CMB45_06180 [Euryarchaeota archaeon]|nr:hypothetical protein [Euryarchaeota archaeon]|tara:strand:- start:10329 stop:10613 length:285 start_codon:yes stop_codon:yes gene_type:complete